ncbi:MAG: anaerobic ribonucleoside-triphosphate reductase [Candidatus Heimdallarchaeota archaeon]
MAKEMVVTKKSKIIHHAEDCEDPSCAYCHSENVIGISRVVGYFSVIENWNKSKKAEFKQRQQGNYWHDEKKK